MTVFLPLQAHAPLPHSPAFLSQSPNVQAQLQKVMSSILKAKRIVVICGAGISVQAGIPDFRSPEGLFKTLKRDNPREALASGKDLFDASVFNSEHTTSLFCQMIAQLSKLSQDAEPTPFHRLLRALDDQGKLLRVYTQNIDAIEQKAGLSFGVPEYEDKRHKTKSKASTTAQLLEENDDQIKSLTPNRLPSSPMETPRCVPLHGTLQAVHCQVCTHSFPLEEHLPSLAVGQPPQCPECTSLEKTRQLVGKRPRGIGKLRPSVVLYNEEHTNGEGVGEIAQKDLLGSKGRCGADLLLVVGTSLRVPGTKRMVREFSKAVRSRASGLSSRDNTGSSSSTSSSSSHPSPSPDDEPAMKSVYLNLDFPVPTREWDSVFDAWLQGDAQEFAQILQAEIEKQVRAKEIAIEKKRKREEEAAKMDAEKALGSSSSLHTKIQSTSASTHKTPKRRSSNDSATSKRRKVVLPPSPPKSPPTSHSRFVSTSEAGPSEFPPIPTVSLTIRIPPRSARKCYIEVPTISSKNPVRPATIQYPPTPQETPPSRFKTSTYGIRSNYHRPCPPPPPWSSSAKAHSYICDSFVNIDLSDDDDDRYDDTLPISCLRSTQARQISPHR